MCIALLTTAHPEYALIVIDNRDEFILRPTSRPHWWSLPPPPAPPPAAEDATAAPSAADSAAAAVPEILSSRDLQRAEHGTWLGISRAGHLAVLTNFREDAAPDSAHPIHGQRSRGAMVTAWLTADSSETTEHFVARLLQGSGVRGVGGFSLICGKLRRQHFQQQREDEEEEKLQQQQQQHGEEGQQETTIANGKTPLPPAPSTSTTSPLAVISNRADRLDTVPWIGGRRGEVYGLSNACFDDPEVWPKVRDGKRALFELAAAAGAAAAAQARTEPGADKEAAAPSSEDKLRDALFAILDSDTLPQCRNLSFEETIPLLKQSIFIPAIGDKLQRADMDKAVAEGPRLAISTATAIDSGLASEERPDQQTAGFMTGLYGTQRQTVILVGWDGRVSFTERALWDANGNAIPRGQGDVHFSFQIQGWDDDE